MPERRAAGGTRGLIFPTDVSHIVLSSPKVKIAKPGSDTELACSTIGAAARESVGVGIGIASISTRQDLNRGVVHQMLSNPDADCDPDSDPDSEDYETGDA